MSDDDKAGEIVGTFEVFILVEIDIDMVSVLVSLGVCEEVLDTEMATGVYELDGDCSIANGEGVKRLRVEDLVTVLDAVVVLLAEEVSEGEVNSVKDAVLVTDGEESRVFVLVNVGVEEDDDVNVCVCEEDLEADGTCRVIVGDLDAGRVVVGELDAEMLRDVVTTAVFEVVAESVLDGLMVPVDD